MRLLALVAVLMLAGCSSQPSWTPDQRLLVQLRLFRGVPKRLVLRAMVTILQEEGYSIRREDPEHGIVTGAKPVAVPAAGKFRKTRLLQNESFEVALHATENEPGVVETRISVQRLATDSFGEVDGREVLMLSVYRAIYGKVRAEVARLVKGGYATYDAPSVKKIAPSREAIPDERRPQRRGSRRKKKA
jgi:hypothetical protein